MIVREGFYAVTIPVALTYHERYDGRGFSPVRESWRRYRLGRELLDLCGMTRSAVRVYRPEPATEAELRLVHTAEYINYVKQADALGVGFLDYGDTPAYSGIYHRGCVAVGGTLLAARLVAEGVVSHAFNPGGGLHHAYADEAGGFCPFNDVVIAVRYLQRQHGYQRIAVLDLDGHHGDGTQSLLYDEPTLYVSLHRFDGRFYPKTGSAEEVGIGAGRGYTLNVPLPRGTADGAYLRALDEQALPRLADYQPDFLIVQIGVDTHCADPLVRFGLSAMVYREIGKRIHSLAHEVCRSRLVAVAGGGYVPANVARCWAIFLGTIADYFPTDDDPLLRALAADEPLGISLVP